MCASESIVDAEEHKDGVVAIRAPLRWIGPYPAVALCFPELATAAQMGRGEKGVTLDFVLDTAANTNTINAEIALQLNLPRVGVSAGGVGAGGAIGGGATYMLGDCELGDLPKDGRFKLMSGLTASALPVASPAAAGLLSIYFLTAFPGGFEFRWGPEATDEASLTLFGDTLGAEHVVAGLSASEVVQLPESGLPTVTIRINGVSVPALLDTGSPITVLNPAAAKATGLSPTAAGGGGGLNPFAKLTAGLFPRRETLQIAGASGQVVTLERAAACELFIGDSDFGQGTCRPYIGELPGLAALNGLGAAAGPAAVLGTDVLRQRPRLVYQQMKIYV